MIQRLQTIFLILVAGCFGALFFLPFATASAVSTQYLADNFYDVKDHPVLLGLTIFGIGVSVLTIFLYKNRKLQQRMVVLIMLLAVGLVVAAYLMLKQDVPDPEVASHVHTQAGMFVPLAVLLLGYFANRYIGKDEKLVKSMDRLR